LALELLSGPFFGLVEENKTQMKSSSSSSSMDEPMDHEKLENTGEIMTENEILTTIVEPTSDPVSVLREILTDEEVFEEVVLNNELKDVEPIYNDEYHKINESNNCAINRNLMDGEKKRKSAEMNSLEDAVSCKCDANAPDFSSDNEMRRRTEFILVDWVHVPPFLRNNPHIRKYYRTYFSYKLCLKSMFRWHNETLNIWTHLIGALVFILFTLYTIISNIVYASMGYNIYVADVFIMLIFEFMAINCFLSSSLYHTFNCHSKKTWQLCYKCDLSAISGLIGGSFFPALYFQLRCYFEWQIVYISSIAVFSLLGMVFPFIPVANKERAIRIFRTIRTVLFLCMVLSAVVPIAHWFIAFKPIKLSHRDYTFFAGLFLMLSLYGMGLIFWLAKIPERFAPGFFDLVGQSHNIWHLLILFAAMLWWFNMNYLLNTIQLVDSNCPI
jgi:adiponectin receptor